MRMALLAVISLVAGTFALVGCKGSEPVAPKNGTVAITADGTGFSPSSVEAKRGEKLELVFTRTSDDTCATEVSVPRAVDQRKTSRSRRRCRSSSPRGRPAR